MKSFQSKESWWNVVRRKRIWPKKSNFFFSKGNGAALFRAAGGGGEERQQLMLGRFWILQLILGRFWILQMILFIVSADCQTFNDWNIFLLLLYISYGSDLSRLQWLCTLSIQIYLATLPSLPNVLVVILLVFPPWSVPPVYNTAFCPWERSPLTLNAPKPRLQPVTFPINQTNLRNTLILCRLF